MRATVEHQENWPSLTPIEVIVVLGKEDLTIKVSILCFIFDSLLREFQSVHNNETFCSGQQIKVTNAVELTRRKHIFVWTNTHSA